RRPRHADRFDPRRAGVHHDHQPVRPQQPADRGPEHRQGPHHRRRRAAAAARPDGGRPLDPVGPAGEGRAADRTRPMHRPNPPRRDPVMPRSAVPARVCGRTDEGALQMSDLRTAGLDRRRFLAVGGLVGAGAVLASCTSNDPDTAGNNNNEGQAAAVGNNDNAAAGKEVTIGFSAPQADHGWIAAISKNAENQAKKFSDVTFEPVEATNEVTRQISSVETLIAKKVSALVILPFDGKALTAVAQKAMAAGIPVVNLDREFDTPQAYRTLIKGDNYGMGVSAATYIVDQLKAKNVSNPVIVEIAGIDNLQLTQDRSRGFKETLAKYGYKVTARQAAQFTVESGQRSPPTSCRPSRRSTRCGTTTTTRASACWPRSTRRGAPSSSWSAAPARPTRCARSRPTRACSRRL